MFLYRNSYLCFDDTIEWRDILSGEGDEVVAERQRLRTCESTCCIAILSLLCILHLLTFIRYFQSRYFMHTSDIASDLYWIHLVEVCGFWALLFVWAVVILSDSVLLDL